MYKLLIADDEAPVIEGLLNNICWEQLGMQVCATSLNGVDAYEQAIALHPDIVITDIRMPLMNGLELIEKVRGYAQDTIFIVYSGYSDFEYAKKSIELDVVYYMIKPSSIEEIELAIGKAIARRQASIERLRSIEERSLYRRLGEVHKLRNSLQGVNELEVYMLEQPIVVLVAGIPALESDDELKRIRTELGAHSWCIDIVWNKRNLTVLLLASSMEQALRMLEEMVLTAVSVGYSDPVQHGDQLKEALEQAQQAMRHAVYTGHAAIPFSAYAYNDVDMDQWNKAISRNARSIDGFKALIASFEDDSRSNWIKPEAFMQQFMAISQLVFNWVDNEVGVSIHKIMGERFLFYKCIMEPISMKNCTRWLHELIAYLEEYIHNNMDPFSVKTIDKLKKYMKDHLAEDISLLSLASVANMSPAYLSSLFKKKSGSSISDYLVFLRMEHAKYLLRETSMKINDVAKASGYNDQRYFSGVFKRYAGSTAGEYRDSFSK